MHAPVVGPPQLSFDVAGMTAVRYPSSPAATHYDHFGLALTTWAGACDERGRDRGFVIRISGDGVTKPGSYSIGDGSGEVNIVIEQVIDRHDAPPEERPACGFLTRATDHAVKGELTIEELNDHRVLGSFEVLFADRGEAIVSFDASICKHPADGAIACEL